MELDLVAVLRVAWVAVTLPIIIASIPISKLSSFRQLISSIAKRGKTMNPSSHVADSLEHVLNLSHFNAVTPLPILQPFLLFIVSPVLKNNVIYLNFVLRVAWVAVTLPIIIASIPISKLSSFHQLISSIAKRGKTMNPSSHKFTVPQRFFSHFYVVAVVWTTLLLLTTWFYAYRIAPMTSESFHFSHIASHLTGSSHIFSFEKSRLKPLDNRYRVWQIVLLLLLMEVQALRRLFETYCVTNYGHSARMTITGYLTGLFYYIAAPLSLCCTCVPEVFEFTVDLLSEYIVKGESRIPAVEVDWWWESVNPLLKLGWRQWIGSAIFFWGWIHQRRCHAILGSLRAHGEQVDKYVIPKGDWFDIVSSPHYLAEIVIYTGLLIASGGDLTVCLLFTFVVANLWFAAAQTHNWYLHKFENYPTDRFAIIPFVY